MERRAVEHHVLVEQDTALLVFCSACARALAEYANNNVISQLQARMVAHEHKEAYSRSHTVVIADMRDKRMEHEGEFGFQDDTPHD